MFSVFHLQLEKSISALMLNTYKNYDIIYYYETYNGTTYKCEHFHDMNVCFKFLLLSLNWLKVFVKSFCLLSINN